MRSARVIIDAGWGDCGKGLMTDYFADADTLVVRFNGGAQAGHTVQTPDGLRHVFHHLGSGTLRGAATYLSRFFICNPIMFNEEWERIRRYGIPLSPVYVSRECPITTPWDMMLNQIAEETRGNRWHGSCGLGINETMVRTDDPDFVLRVGDVLSFHYLEHIQLGWIPKRLVQLKLVPDDMWMKRLTSKDILKEFAAQLYDFRKLVVLDNGDTAKSWSGPVLFEGAQGLLLDQDHSFFPYVTHSHTGLTNVDILAREWGIDALDVVYVLRSYATRHGPGPFPGEDPTMRFEDLTNVPNLWQGGLRFGKLQPELLIQTIKDDLGKTALPCQRSLVMTHMDQYDGWDEIPDICREIGGKSIYTSYGPTRNDIGGFRPITTPKPYPGNPLTRRDKLACALADTICLAFANHTLGDPVPVWDWWRARMNETLRLEGVAHDW